MKKFLVIFLSILPFIATAQEVKIEKPKKHHSLVKGYLTASYLLQAYNYTKKGDYPDLRNPRGFSIGGGIKKINSNDAEKIGFSLGLEASRVFYGTDSYQGYETYLKAEPALVIERHVNDLFVYHFDGGVNIWESTNYNTYVAPCIGAGIGLKGCLLRASYEYGLGNAFKSEFFMPKVQASTFSIGLIFYPTGR